MIGYVECFATDLKTVTFPEMEVLHCGQIQLDHVRPFDNTLARIAVLAQRRNLERGGIEPLSRIMVRGQKYRRTRDYIWPVGISERFAVVAGDERCHRKSALVRKYARQFPTSGKCSREGAIAEVGNVINDAFDEAVLEIRCRGPVVASETVCVLKTGIARSVSSGSGRNVIEIFRPGKCRNGGPSCRKPLFRPYQQRVVIAVFNIGQVRNGTELRIRQYECAVSQRRIKVSEGRKFCVLLPVIVGFDYKCGSYLLLDTK